MYPLRFEPVFRQYLWGGRRLGDVLDKPIGEGDDYAESWELVDHGEDQSRVAFGEFAGQTLSEMLADHATEIMGAGREVSQFPLLFKLLDAQKKLSVQVHPDDARAALLDPPDLGKTEAWVIIDSQPDSLIYAGLKRGFDRDALAREVARGTTELCLHSFHPEPGDCIFIPAGVVHAIGAGLLVAEIQQASDTTYRLFDWNRVDKHGQARDLHIEQGLEAIDYERGPVDPQTPTELSDGGELLVECDKFTLRRWKIDGECELPNNGKAQILSVVSGSLLVAGDPSERLLATGHTTLIPAALGAARVTAQEPSIVLSMNPA